MKMRVSRTAIVRTLLQEYIEQLRADRKRDEYKSFVGLLVLYGFVKQRKDDKIDTQGEYVILSKINYQNERQSTR